MNCGWVKSRITLYLYAELDDAERIELERHTERCAECAAQVEHERRLHRLLDARPAPALDANLLAACRLGLSEALEAEPPRRAFAWPRLRLMFGALTGLRPRLQPALAIAAVVVAFIGGWTLSARRSQPGALPVFLQSREDVGLANISSIHAINTGASGQLEIVFDTTRRRVLRGTMEDPRIEQVLLYAAQGYSNPVIRLDSIELLKSRAGDQEIRRALIAALRADRNPGVRLKALEALQGMVADAPVKQALLDVLRSDENPGMRIQAINHLSKLRDASTVPLLQQLAIGDPSNVVRMRSASALKDLNAPDVF